MPRLGRFSQNRSQIVSTNLTSSSELLTSTCPECDDSGELHRTNTTSDMIAINEELLLQTTKIVTIIIVVAIIMNVIKLTCSNDVHERQRYVYS